MAKNLTAESVPFDLRNVPEHSPANRTIKIPYYYSEHYGSPYCV